MNRKEFFKRLAVVTGAAILTPKVLLDSNELNPRGEAILIEGTFRPTNHIQIFRSDESLHYFLNTKHNIDNR